MKPKHLLVSRGEITTIKLNRPEVRNAMSDVTLQEITAEFKALSKSPSARAVVISGEGKDFCAGADIEWMRRAGRLGPAQGRKDARHLIDMCRAVDECPVPVIARVHGAIYGGGLGVVSACDIVVAEENARMCFSECRLGILPAVVSCFVLPKIGLQARRFYLTSEVFGMAKAKEIGLVHEVVPAGELEGTVVALTAQILRNGPRAVRQAKALIRNLAGLPLDKRVKICVETLVKTRSSPEGQEGLSAFLEKRSPAWIKP